MTALGWKSTAWTAALLAAAFLWYAAVEQFGLLPFLGVLPMPPHFMDWYGVVAASDCAKLGYNVFLQNPCDALGRLHNYGTIWLKLGSLGLTRGNGWWTGLLIAIGFVVAAAVALRPRSPRDFAIALAAIGSPAVLLGVERANVDLIVFAALLGATFLLMRPTALGKWLSAAIYLLLTVAKLYPMVAFVSVFWSGGSRRSALFAFAGFIAAVAVWGVLDADEIKTVIGVFQKPGLNPLSHGGSLLYATLIFQQWIPATIDADRAALITLGLVYLCSLFCARHLHIDGQGAIRNRVLFVAGASIAVLAFGMTTNFDYRNIFLLLALPLVVELSAETQGAANGRLRAVARACLWFLMFTLWANLLLVSMVPVAVLVNADDGLARSLISLGYLAKHLGHWILIFLFMLLGNALLLQRWRMRFAGTPLPSLEAPSPA